MKHIKNILSLSSLVLLFSITSCNSNKFENKTDDDSKDESTDIPTKIDPIFEDGIKSMGGFIDTNFNLNLLDGIEPITVPLINTNINISYKIASNINEITDYYKGIEFHVNLDLYSDESNFANSLITQKLLPSLFGDFKYTKIANNISDLDVYYLGDGMLYASLSTFEGEFPSRDSIEAIKNAPREVINITRMDVKAIINQLGDKLKEEKDNIDFKDIFNTLTSTLNGVTIDVELLTDIFVKSLISFNDGGFSFSLKEEGISNLNTFINSEINSLINNSSLGITLEDDSKLLEISSFETSLTSSSFNLKIDNKDSISPLIEIYLNYLNDSIELNPTVNLEEEYIYSKNIIKKADELYLGYSNYKLNDEYKITFQELINNVISLDEKDFKIISGFNNSNGYPLLIENEDNTYGYLSDYEDMLNDYNSLNELLDLDLSNDKNKLIAINTLLDNFINGNNHYSDYLKDNILEKVKNNDSSKYDNLINTLNNFFNDSLSNYIEDINLSISNYKSNKNPTLKNTQKFLLELLNKTDFSSLLINNEIYNDDINLLKSDDKITKLSLNYIKEFINSDLFEKKELEIKNNDLNNIISNYLTQIKKEIKNIDNDFSLLNDYSNLLLFNNDTKLENIYDFIDLINSTSYKNNIKNEYHSLIDQLISILDKKLSLELDKIILEENIYKLNKEEKVLKAYISLTSTYYEYYSKYIENNKLFSKYINNFKSIDKYNKLKSLLEDELKYYY